MAVFHYLQSFHITGQLWEEAIYQWITLMLSFHVFFAASLNKLLNKQSVKSRWFETPWLPCDDNVMIFWKIK